MENQHRKIAGYTEFDQDTIDLMNKIKLHGQVLNELVEEVKLRTAAQRAEAQDDAGLLRHLQQAEPERWAALARTNLQQGLMFLTRAVAQPEF